ncbi:MAG: hypothetical protein QNJ97_27640 [Myxococcota bacterium]|nr:hypothetical protein [Myxococcota bacterium]
MYLDDTPLKKRSRRIRASVPSYRATIRLLLYHHFRESLGRPVYISKWTEMNRPLIYWKDWRGCLNYLDYHRYRSPKKGEPLTNMIPRISVNRFCVHDEDTLIEDLCGVCGLDRLWRSEISVLPSEVPLFAEWIAAIFKALEKEREYPIPPPPYDCYVGTEGYPISEYIWSASARKKQCEYDGRGDSGPGILKLRPGANRPPTASSGEGIQKVSVHAMEMTLNEPHNCQF